ncbi:MAG TPA: sortase [Candidatus Saccharimonadales bacterium]|nr:sortase [Candidatus Saccharimonadales bacterium]
MSNDNKDNKPHDKVRQQQDAAANVLRQKLIHLYNNEPEAGEELAKVKELHKKHSGLSKHQKYMEDLSKSGRSLAEIQKAWHDYYQKLPDKEKHEVWQEFYEQHAKRRRQQVEKPAEKIVHKVEEKHKEREQENKAARQPSTVSAKRKLLEKVAARARRNQKKSPAHALLFGLGMGTLFVFIILFSFFNERFITPFIRPNQNVSATPIIIDPTQAGKISKAPKIIIPKLNVEVPVVYGINALDEDAVQKGLEHGVVHYSITPNPGEKGNAVIVGHSSSNILNSGKYKFAFLLLKSLEKGDLFYVQKDGKRYVYKVFNKFITSPTDLSVLNPTDRVATVTLITCDPPGLSINRMIVQGEQIYPDPKKDKAGSVDVTTQAKPAELGGNSISLWQRIKNWF